MVTDNQSNYSSVNILKPLEELVKNNLTIEQKNVLRDAVNFRVFSPALSDNLTLILGCQRSGTTLALLMLQAHPQVKGIDETEFPSPFPFPSSIALYYHQLKKQSICLKLPEHIFNLDYIARHFPKVNHITYKSSRGSVSGQGALKKTVFDRLFSINHTLAMLRAKVSRLFRRSWNTTKRIDRLQHHVAIYMLHHNKSILKKLAKQAQANPA